ncbi:hypothetical protein CSA08_01350 [Candidatus Gracilibacteria bacterium]|nr:MAG: hypothetical protein CSA08_01350 [Candidatus Gracilibacteria bacterium]
MGNPVQNDDEIIILSDDNDSSTLPELEFADKENESSSNKEEKSDITLDLKPSDEGHEDKELNEKVDLGLNKNKGEDDLGLDLDLQNNDNKSSEEKILSLKEEDTEEEVKIKDSDSTDADSISFDFGGDEQSTKSDEVEKESKSLDLIIDGTILQLNERKKVLEGKKNSNLEEEEFRNSEINRLNSEIKDLKSKRDLIESEIKQIDKNVVSLGDMKISTKPK